MAGYAPGSRYRDASTAPRHVFIVPDVPRPPGPHGDKTQRAGLREDALRLLGCEH